MLRLSALWRQRFLFSATTFLVLMTVGSVKATDSQAANLAAVALACGDCWNCGTLPQTHFSSTEDVIFPSYALFGNGHFECLIGSCETTYGPCFAARPDIGKAVVAIQEELRDASYAGVIALADKFPNAILLNEERRALQVIGCAGEVVAHFPLNSNQAVEAGLSN